MRPVLEMAKVRQPKTKALVRVSNKSNAEQVETYRFVKEIELYSCKAIPAQRNSGVARRQTLCQDLGLNAQAKFSGEDVSEAKKGYEQLYGHEFKVWSIYLPKRYSRNDGDWKDFQFDIIPLLALEEIKFADSLSVFDNLEIWSPEQKKKVNPDPMAIGVVGQRPNEQNPSRTYHLFKICRWGEALKPFVEVELAALLLMTPRIEDFDDKTPLNYQDLPRFIRDFREKLFAENPDSEYSIFKGFNTIWGGYNSRDERCKCARDNRFLFYGQKEFYVCCACKVIEQIR